MGWGADCKFGKSDLPQNYPYTNVFIISSLKKHIKCVTVQELLEGNEVTTVSRNYLG